MATLPQIPRGLFTLAVILVGIGSCGTMTGAVGVQLDTFVPVGPDADPGSEEEAQAQAQLLVADAVLRSAYRKPLAGANALVSILLLFSGLVLFRHRTTAVWWVTQASLANGALALLEAAAQWVVIEQSWNELVAFQAEAGRAAGQTFLVTLVVTTALRLGLYLWLIWRVRRPDIRGALSDPA